MWNYSVKQFGLGFNISNWFAEIQVGFLWLGVEW